MITKYTEYIKESNNADDTIDILVDFLDGFTNKYLYTEVETITNAIGLYDEDLDEYIVNLIVSVDNTHIQVLYHKELKDSSIYYVKDIKSLFKAVRNFLENYYDILEISDYYENEIKKRKFILNVPMVNIEKFCDFVYKLSLKDNNIFNLFYEQIYLSKNYKDIGAEFYKKYPHLIDAKNFDLL